MTRRWLTQLFREWLADGRAAEELTDQFWNATGHTLPFTRAEGREFRLSGLTAHEWLSK